MNQVYEKNIGGDFRKISPTTDRFHVWSVKSTRITHIAMSDNLHINMLNVVLFLNLTLFFFQHNTEELHCCQVQRQKIYVKLTKIM